MGPDDAAADDEHLAGGHAGHPAEQRADAARRALEVLRAGLDGEAARDLTHRLEEGQLALLVEGLVREAVGAGGDTRVGQRAVGREVEVGEEHLPLAHPAPLDLERLLDLHDHVALGPDPVDVGFDGRAGGAVLVVGEAGAEPRPRLHEHLVAVRDQLLRAGGAQGDAVLVGLDLFDDADLQGAGVGGRCSGARVQRPQRRGPVPPRGRRV